LEFVEYQNKQCKVTKKLPMTPPPPQEYVDYNNSIQFIDSPNMMAGIQSYITK
jgi:hypothetical protein